MGPHFNSLLEVFQYCDPGNVGHITHRTRFVEIAKVLTGEEGDIDDVWRTLDLDGNGNVNFREFVEWAENRIGDRLPLGLHDSDDFGSGGVTLPKSWSGPKDGEALLNWNHRIKITDADHLGQLQDVLDKSYKAVWTRDRKATGKTAVPKSYELQEAYANENFSDWRGYYMKRHLLTHNCNTRHNILQFSALTNSSVALCQRHALRANCNEWLLFHGTNADSAKEIMEGDFTMRLAGTATGTLYGRGTYFAESITKSDEYAKAAPDGTCCVLLCRIAGGNVLYNAEVTPDAAALQETVLSGSYNTIIGDREKCRGTFKEYVIFDADQIYAAYALFYKRIYE